MRGYNILIFLTAAAIFSSCEDKKTSKDNEVKNVQELPVQPDSASVDNTTIEKVVKAEEEQQKKRPEGPLLVQEELIPFLTRYGKENPEDKVRIETRFGNIDVQLYKDTPLHRANFIFLVKQDYFDNTFFHRVAEDFVIQAGNSDTPETNKKRHYIGDYLIPSEFEAGHRHVRGAFSAAKYAEQNVSKASSPYEFFIVQSERGAHHIDNDHTVFGRVIDGMEVVDSIAKVPVDGSEWPLKNIYIDAKIIE